MMKKSLFLSARFFVFLLLAIGVSVLAIPKGAEADGTHTIRIEWIKIFKLDDSDFVSRDDVDLNALPIPLRDRADLRTHGPTRAPWLREGMFGPEESYGVVKSAQRTDLYVKYVKIDLATGYPIGGEEVGSDDALGPGDIIGVAVRLQNVSAVRWNTNIHLSWADGGNGYTLRANHHRFDLPTTNLPAFTALYTYRIEAGETAENSGWLTDTPLIGYPDGRVKEVGHNVDPATLTWSGTLSLPAIDSVPPTISTDTTKHRLTIAPPPAGQSGKSRYHEVRQTCLENHGLFGDDYINACPHVEAPGWSTVALDEVTHEAAYYKAGDEIAITVRFSEKVKVSTDPAKQPTFYIKGDGYEAELKYKEGSGEDFLTFSLPVTEGQHTFGGLQVWSAAFWRNTHENFCRAPDTVRLETDEVRWIRDLAGNDFDTCVSLEKELEAFFTNMPALESIAHANPHPSYREENRPEIVAAYKKGIIKYLVDTIPATVWIPGLIKNGELLRHTEFTASDVQTGAFEVQFRFFNSIPPAPGSGGSPAAIADEVGTSFTAEDVMLTGTGVNPADWDVEIAYVGLDHRGPNIVQNSASALVYKATITPALGFRGDVSISVPAGATQDIAGNESLASNRLPLPVDTALRVIETPEIVAPPAGAYTAGDKIEVEVTYDKENLRYEGDNPPYLTLYLGEEVPANARHATWQRAEDTNSTKVTFAYTVAATDTVAEAVRVPSVKILVPEDTMLLSGPLGASAERQSGTEEPAAASGTAPKTVPTVEPLPEVSPIVSDTPVVPVYPIIEETAPKAAASDVPRSPIVFNELGNGSGDADDWLELRNVTGSAVSLKDWELSVVQDGKKEDTSLIVFPDASVPANGLLLITNSAPDKTPLAAGDDITTSDVEKKGSPHLYLVNAGLSLPDDGKFLLILRNAKEKLGLNEAFVDVAGGGGSDTDAFVREQTGDYDTHVWPLQVLQAPGGDTEDALGSGKVWQRANAGVVGYHKDAWAESAFTGIGYDRKVSESPATSGTPGYPNGAVKTEAATPKGSVTLSEIMFDSAGGTLPQWIELYNNSKTDAINLNRWRLEIQNVDSEDLVGRPIVTLTLSEKVIQPNQTLLIVAGPARASSDSYLPADRVYDLLALHEKNLRIKRARDTFLSTEGFYLQLSDRNGNLVDEVGNRDSDRRSDDAPAWALPLSFEEGSRSSLIRRYDKGVALPGRKRASWVLAARIKPFDERLHYGHAEDIGTPGHREGGALPVELSSFAMTRNEAGAVVLTWTTESEVDNAGFNLRRSEQRASGFTLLNPALIAGAGTTGERQTYTFTDTSAKPGIEYYYQIEEVAFDGKPETLVTRLLPGPVSASNRMLTTFGEVKRQK